MHLSMNGVVFGYDSSPVLRDVCIELEAPCIMGILGPNGSGKTTLMRCMNRILTPQQGRVLLNGDDVCKLRRTDVAKNLGYVPQSSAVELASPEVFEVVLSGRRPFITWGYSEKDRDMAWNAMAEMGVEDLAASDFSRLSSGQAQRVLMARALAQEAGILLLDEPTSNLDVKYQLDVMRSVRRLVEERGIGACVIVHDLDLAMRFCDKAVLLQDGSVVAAGDVRDVLTPGNIRKVYEVDAAIDDSYGRPRVVIL